MERKVTINADQELYVIHHDDGITSCYGFDNTVRDIENISMELAGRGALPEQYIETPLMAARGTMQAWDILQSLQEHLRKVCEEQGDQAVYALSPQLDGLEGHRVEVETVYGETRRFIVGKSTGWAPCHLEIARRDSSGGGGAERHYRSVRDLGPVR